VGVSDTTAGVSTARATVADFRADEYSIFFCMVFRPARKERIVSSEFPLNVP